MKSKTAFIKFNKGWALISALGILISPVSQASSTSSLRAEQSEINGRIAAKKEELRENKKRFQSIKSHAEDNAPQFKGECDRPCRAGVGACSVRDFQNVGIEALSALKDSKGEKWSLASSADYACVALHNAAPALEGLSPTCRTAVTRCGEVAKSLEMARLEAANKEIEADIRALNEERRLLTREYAEANKACPQCAYMEAYTNAMKPTGGQLAVGIANAVAPIAVAGIGAWQFNKALNAQIGIDRELISSNNQIGIPTQYASLGVPAMASGAFGGYGMGFVMSGYGMGMGYGSPFGMGNGMGFGLNLGLGFGMGNGFGMGSPYGAVANPFGYNPGYGFNGALGCVVPPGMSPWGNSGWGLNVGLGMNSPWGMSMYNPYASMMNPMAMNPYMTGMYSNPWGMGPGIGINGSIGINVGSPWGSVGWNSPSVGPWGQSPWSTGGFPNGGGYNAYYMQMQQQQMMQQQQQAQMQMQMQMQYQQQQQAQYQAYLQQEMQRQMAAAQAQQDLMIAQQQMQEAQMRYYQSMQGGGFGGGGISGGFGVQIGFGSSNPWFGGAGFGGNGFGGGGFGSAGGRPFGI